jgi:hypothetical protein
VLRAPGSERKYASAQEMESAAAVQPFNEFKPVNLPLNLSVAPVLFYRTQHRFIIPLDSSDEAFHFGYLRLLTSYQPRS